MNRPYGCLIFEALLDNKISTSNFDTLLFHHYLIMLTLLTACTPRLSKLTSGVLCKADDCHTFELRLFKNGTFFLIQTVCDVAMHDLAFGKYQFKENMLYFEYDKEHFSTLITVYFSRRMIISNLNSLN